MFDKLITGTTCMLKTRILFILNTPVKTEDNSITDCMEVLSHSNYTLSANERIMDTLAPLLEKQISDTGVLIHLPNATPEL